jgi:SAM-dependent methyltransferase
MGPKCNRGDMSLLIKHKAMFDKIQSISREINISRVLELGSDSQGCMVRALAESPLGIEAIGVNPVLKSSIAGERWKVLSADARSLPFEDSSFDVVISVAAFEHFFELDLAIEEAYRVLKVGGVLLSNFGPIWSGCWGHHLWIQNEGTVYNYNNIDVPPYGHLIMERAEMKVWFKDRYGDVIAEKAVDYLYDSAEQNRLFFDDYERIFSDSKFDVSVFKGNENNERKKAYSEKELSFALDSVKFKFSSHYGFKFDSITVKLVKTF